MKFKLPALLLLLAFALPHDVWAKKKRPMKKAQAVFTTDWSNSDSLLYYFEQKYEEQNWTLALRISDSILQKKVLVDFDELLSHQLKRVNMLAFSKKRLEAMLLLQDLKSTLPSEKDEIGNHHIKIIETYKALGEKDSALVEYEKLFGSHTHLMNERIERLNQDLINQRSELQGANASLDNLHAGYSKLKVWFWAAIALAFLLAIFSFALMLKNRKLKKRQASQREQMIHTQTQIEKAFDEEERIAAEIKKMKEQVARNEAEKNLLKQNVKESTSETLPLLKSQLEAIIRENKEAIPVERYMQLQNTIARFNKQMRDVAGLE